MASVKQAWIKKYGLNKGLRKWEDRIKLSACTIEGFSKKYGNEIGSKKYQEWKDNIAFSRTLPAYIKKHGKKMGQIEYQKKNSHLSVSTQALKAAGKSDGEIKNIQETHRKKSTITLETLTTRYGRDIGEKKWNQRIHLAKISSKRCLDYWIDKCNGDIEKAKLCLTDHQRRDKNFYIQKYGEVSGLEKYESAKRKRFLGGFIEPCSKFQSEVGDFMRGLGVTIYDHKSPWIFFLTEADRVYHTQSIYIPDIVLREEKIIVECFGDYWHCNPARYLPTFFHEVIKKTAKEIWEKDDRRVQYYKEKKFDTIVIWENDWTNKQDSCKQRIIDEIDKKRSYTKLHS